MLDDGFEDFQCVDSTLTKLRDSLPESGESFQFDHEYDFGDGWEHDVLFEGLVNADPGKRYPCCVDGARACPPEDVGGVEGYPDYFEILADSKHKEHRGFLAWRGTFDPEALSADEATESMRKECQDPRLTSSDWLAVNVELNLAVLFVRERLGKSRMDPGRFAMKPTPKKQSNSIDHWALIELLATELSEVAAAFSKVWTGFLHCEMETFA